MADFQGMILYQVRFFNHGDHTVGSDTLRAASDEDAILRARIRFTSPFGRGHEIWDGERLVHREIYGK